MATDYQLRDDWKIVGNDIEGFTDACMTMDRVTSFVRIKPAELSLLSYAPEKSTEEYYDFYGMKPGEVIPQERKITKTALAKVPKELVDEMLNYKLMLGFQNKAVFTAQTFVPTLVSRCGLGGDRVAIPSRKRDEYFAEIMNDLEEATLVARTANGAKKAFALHSGKYGPVKQSVLPAVVDLLEPMLGKVKVKQWEVTQELTSILLEFPDKAEDVSKVYSLPDVLTPILYLSTSDTGDASVTALGGWKIKGTNSFDTVSRRVHKGSVDEEKILKKIDKEIFSKYTVLPERLVELMTIPVEDPMCSYEQLIEKTKLKKIIGDKMTAYLLSVLEGELNPSLKYTAYNMVVNVMDLPRRIGSGYVGQTQIAIKQACGRAAFVNCDYSKKRKLPTIAE